MAKRKKLGRTHRQRPDAPPASTSRPRSERHVSRQPRQTSPTALADILLHPHTSDERPWNYLLLVLALAFVARTAIALYGDFVVHPDEIMQYLEPAHRLVFGNGVTYWEYFYGARSWLVPGVVAGTLKVFDLLGLGEPFWYVGGVKLVFCALSLLIPAGMYFFARRHFGETSARVALVAGAFWYELAGFGHKPMTEFVATALLLALFALCIRPAPDKPGTVWLTAFLAVLTAMVRLQYAPLALLLLGVFLLRTGKKAQLALAAAAFFLAVGLFDAVTWDGGLFHSYLTNIRFNLVLGEGRAGESPGYQFLWWLLLAGTGLSALCTAVALRDPRRYGFLLALIGVVLLIHSLQTHKEYRFVFVVIPLWLLIGADVVARLAARVNRPHWVWGLSAALFAAVSLCGIANALPAQNQVYRAWSRETGKVGFIRDQDPIFAAYHYLARAPDVMGVWQVDRPYFNLPGYYYLHHDVPFYDSNSGHLINKDMATISASVSHIVSAMPDLSVPDYTVVEQFGDLRIWRRDDNEAPVRQWEAYTPVITGDLIEQIMAQVDPDAPTPPANAGIRFAAGP